MKATYILLFFVTCCISVPVFASQAQKAFLDAQTLVDGWEASYCHIDSLKVSGTRILVSEKGQSPTNRQQIPYYHHERIQDGTKFLVRFTGTPQGFDNGADYRVNSFDGSIGNEYVNISNPSSPFPRRGVIYRGLANRAIEKDNVLAEILQTMPNIFTEPSSGEDEPWKVKLNQQYPLGIPFFLEKYNKALAVGEVKVRPHLEYVAGEACHVLELDLISRIETFWFAHEKGMLPMKTMYVSSPDRVIQKVKTREVKEIVSVATKTGILWYPRVIMEEATKGPDYSYAIKVTINEFVPHFKAPPETFNYVFPSGTLVLDKIKDLEYIVGPYGPKIPGSLIGKTLLDFNDVDIKLPADTTKNKMILVCFFDMNQQPSRNYLLQLNKRTKELLAEDVVMVAIQVSKVEEDKLNDWVKKNNILFPVGIIQDDEEKICFTWGVRSLPWLILTDKKRIVTAEGFTLAELDDKLNINSH